MAYTSIPDSQREVGKPITKDLLDTIHSNLEDLNTRVSSISLAAGSNVILNELVKKPKDSLPIGTIIFGSLTASQVTAETDGGEWVAADGSNVSGSDWATLTGKTVLPDVRGRFLRAKANGSGNSPTDPALDAYTADTVVGHSHVMSHTHDHNIVASASVGGGHAHHMFSAESGDGSLSGSQPVAYLSSGSSSSSYNYQIQKSAIEANIGLSGTAGEHSHTISVVGSVQGMTGNTGQAGSDETAPRYVTENAFIKINRAYITTEARLFALRVDQQTTINNIIVSPVQQGTSGSFTIDIKKGATPTTASQSIFQSGQLPTLAYNGSSPVTGLTDSNQNTVAAGQYLVVSVSATQAKLKEVHIYIGGDY